MTTENYIIEEITLEQFFAAAEVKVIAWTSYYNHDVACTEIEQDGDIYRVETNLETRRVEQCYYS